MRSSRTVTSSRPSSPTPSACTSTSSSDSSSTPASVSIVSYTPLRPFVLRVNDVGGDLSFLAPRKGARRRRRAPSSDATLGGGLGAADSA